MLAAAGLAIAALTQAGCMSRMAADPRRERLETASYDSIKWPARLTEDLDEKIRNTPRRISRFTLDGSVPADQIDPRWRDTMRRLAGRVFYNRKFGQGLIRVALYDGRLYTRFVSYSPLTDRPRDERADPFVKSAREWVEKFVKVNIPGIRPTDERTLSLLSEGTILQLSEPSPEKGKPVGLVVHMAGLGSVQYEQPLLDELRARGWAVLRIETPSLWWFKSPAVTISRPDQIPDAAASLARTIDDMVAESAYAAEAALDYLAERKHEIPQSPLVVVGCSAGSLATPAVVARLNGRVDSVVLVGAGANLLKLSQTSDLTNGGIALHWTDQAGSAADRNRLYDTYLACSHLDPYRTAALMRHMPVLMVQAALDSTVPASGGDLLWQRLGRPECWTFAAGHRLMFWKLGEHSKEIADWVESNTPGLKDGQAASVAAP